MSDTSTSSPPTANPVDEVSSPTTSTNALSSSSTLKKTRSAHTLKQLVNENSSDDHSTTVSDANPDPSSATVSASSSTSHQPNTTSNQSSSNWANYTHNSVFHPSYTHLSHPNNSYAYHSNLQAPKQYTPQPISPHLYSNQSHHPLHLSSSQAVPPLSMSNRRRTAMAAFHTQLQSHNSGGSSSATTPSAAAAAAHHALQLPNAVASSIASTGAENTHTHDPRSPSPFSTISSHQSSASSPRLHAVNAHTSMLANHSHVTTSALPHPLYSIPSLATTSLPPHTQHTHHLPLTTLSHQSSLGHLHSLPHSSSASSLPTSLPLFTHNSSSLTNRSELQIVNDKLREMSLEVSRLHRQMKEYNSAYEEGLPWFLRYTKRAVILSNLFLGTWIFLLKFFEAVRNRDVKQGLLAKWFIPPTPELLSASETAPATTLNNATFATPTMITDHMTTTATAANPARNGLTSMIGSVPLSHVLISGFLQGFQSSFFFYSSSYLFLRSNAWKRNMGFFISTLYSSYLIFCKFRPRTANWLNIGFNVLYICARYYYLHGLLVFNDMRIL